MQDFVVQENKRESDKRAAERDIEKAKIAAEEAKIAQQHEIELAKVEAEKVKIAQQREIELAKVEVAKNAKENEFQLARSTAEEKKSWLGLKVSMKRIRKLGWLDCNLSMKS